LIALIDSHSHFDVDAFEPDRAAALQRAKAAGVVAQIVPGIAADTWDTLRTVCAEDDSLHPAYGLHPTFLDRHRPEHLEELRRWIVQEKPCAVGECGLDRFIENPRFEEQERYFVGQCELAAEFCLPLVVHARRAVEDVILTLRRFDGLRGVVHSYGGSMEQAEQLFALGFSLGIGGRGDLRTREPYPPRGGADAARLPAAGNRQPGPAQRDAARTAQRTRTPDRGPGLRCGTAR
jgi:TatD DNase family protein